MDCRQAQEILSDRHSSELVDASSLDAALTHSDSCPTCAAFARSLVTLDAIPSPEAPERAVELALDAVRREQSAEKTQETEDFEVNRIEEVVRPKGWWIGRFAITASTAVVFLGAVILSVSVMTAPLDRASDGIADIPLTLSEGTESDRSQDTDDAETAGSTEAPPAEVAAPDYVAFDGVVYRVFGERTGAEIATETVGTLFTAKDDPFGVPRPYPVFRGIAETDMFIEGTADDTYVLIVPLTRTYGGTTYSLVANDGLEAYGDWPDLPSYMPRPALPDGSPVFIEDGKDAQGTMIYVRAGVPSSSGIAVGPGTSPSDPAGENPNWTWWEPY